MSISDVKIVLITGFAPFEGADDVNPSWEGVKAMNKDNLESRLVIQLYREQIEVKYNHVDQCVPQLWQKYCPDLTIHVGVSGDASCFVLEKQARKESYELEDMDGVCPVDNKCTTDGPDRVATGINVEAVCQKFNSDPPAEGLEAQESNDAGKYLCEYTYYTSLCQGSPNTLFVHVPQYDYSHSAQWY